MPDPERGRGIGFPLLFSDEMQAEEEKKKKKRCFDPVGSSVTKWIGMADTTSQLSWSVSVVVVAVAQPRAMLCLAEKDNEA